jgi:hypothetical protein
MVEFMRDWINSENGLIKQNRIKGSRRVYLHGLNSGNRFLEKWVRFDTELKNILSLVNAKMLGLDAVNLIVGDDLWQNG